MASVTDKVKVHFLFIFVFAESALFRRDLSRKPKTQAITVRIWMPTMPNLTLPIQIFFFIFPLLLFSF